MWCRGCENLSVLASNHTCTSPGLMDGIDSCEIVDAPDDSLEFEIRSNGKVMRRFARTPLGYLDADRWLTDQGFRSADGGYSYKRGATNA